MPTQTPPSRDATAINRIVARRIIEGAHSVSIFGEQMAARARVYTINSFSAHSDQGELLAWHAHAAAPRTFLVRGNEQAMQAFAQRLQATRVEMPLLHQQFEL